MLENVNHFGSFVFNIFKLSFSFLMFFIYFLGSVGRTKVRVFSPMSRRFMDSVTC